MSRSKSLLLVLVLSTFTLAAENPTAEELALRPYVPPAAPAAADWPNERLVKFLDDLTDYIYKNHVVADPQRMVYGMTYEFFQDGKQIQTFLLDAMHDGAWFASAQLEAQRILPQGNYLERVRQYQLPFYTNMMNNSDRLFPHKKPNLGLDHGPWRTNLKGWVPRGWDDGPGWDHDGHQHNNPKFQNANSSTIEMKEGKFRHAYSTSSNHLASDLADFLLNAWVSTRDPAVREAMQNLYNYRGEYYTPMNALIYPQGFMTGDKKLMATARPVVMLLPETADICYRGMFLQKSAGLPGYDDIAVQLYRQLCCEAALTGVFPEESAWSLAYTVLDNYQAMEYYHDNQPWPVGMVFFDIQEPSRFTQEGKLNKYLSDGGLIFGGRGIEFARLGAAVLPMLRQSPEVWERRQRERDFAGRASWEPIVRIVDNPPETDGRRDAAYENSYRLEAEKVKISLVSDPRNLHLFIESSQPKVVIAITHDADMTSIKRTGEIELASDGKIAVTNDKGEKLLHVASFKAGETWACELRIPYTIVKAQKLWINGVEHGRYRLTVDGGRGKVVYFLSDPQRIIRRMEMYALGTVQTWYDIWQQVGCIPSGWRAPGTGPNKDWELSDAGNYAHLVSAIAAILMDRAGTPDWQLMRQDLAREPRPGKPLPETVRAAQGLD